MSPVGDPAAYTGTETISVIADSVQNLSQATTTFYYYDASGNLMNNLSQIGSVRFVTANVIVDVNPADTPTQLTLKSSAAMRNLINH